MTYAFEGLSVVVTAIFGLGGFLLLLERSPRFPRVGVLLRRLHRRVTGRDDLGWLEWWHLALAVGVLYALVVSYDLATAWYSCPAGGGQSDLIGYLNSGRALLRGGDPFTVSDCGGTINEPYGISSILVSALGSPAGIPGIAFVWGVVGVSLVPLTWYVAGPDRRYLTLFVVASPLYLPLIATQIDGAGNAIVPFTVLVGLLLAARGEPVAAAIGGFLATGRFPTVFPVAAAFGPTSRRYVGAITTFAAFGLVTLATYAVWRSSFLDVVFFSQINRRSFSLNFYEILQHGNLLPTGPAIPILQAVLTLGVAGFAFFRLRPPLRAAAFTLTGVALLTQYLSFNWLVALMPVTLVGARPRWWVWAIGIVAALNYDVAFSDWAILRNVYLPTELLDVLLTVLLLGLLLDVAREQDLLSPTSA